MHDVLLVLIAFCGLGYAFQLAANSPHNIDLKELFAAIFRKNK